MGLKINGEVVQLAQGQVQRDDASYEIEFDGASTVSLLLTNLSQTAPAGRFRLHISADELEFQRGQDAALSNWATFFKVTSAGPVVSVNGAQTNLATLAKELTELKDYMALLKEYIVLTLGQELLIEENLLLDGKLPSEALVS